MARYCAILVVTGLCWAAGGLPGCTYNPVYGDLICGYGGVCPPGYFCQDSRCLPIDQQTEPDAGTTADGDAPVPDNGGPDEDGPDAQDAGEDAGFDAGPADDGGGLVDAGQDAGEDAGADPGSDPGLCTEPCSPGQYCNPADGLCYPCEVFDHCGPECLPCQPDTQCRQMAGQFCCIPDCSLDNLCQQAQCGATLFTCAADVSAQTAEWYLDTELPLRACRWTPMPGPLPESCADERRMRYRCSWDGRCETGQCFWDSGIENLHDCTQKYGCNQQIGRCRRHLPLGDACQFNYDCESFCCSRMQQATCIEFEPNSCKMFYGHIDGVAQIFRAFADLDPHNMEGWSYVSMTDIRCDENWECDSGRCVWDVVARVCTYQECVDGTDEASIRATYFCGTGDHQAHIDSVTNTNALPGPGSCP